MINEHPQQFLDSSFETLLDSILLTAYEVCGVSLALISFRESEQHIFKPSAGSEDITNVLRHSSLNDDIADIGAFIEIPDASQDDRFWEKSYVDKAPHIRFIAGVPIRRPLGEIVGVLSVVDIKPIYLNAQQRTALNGLANIIGKALVARKTSLKVIQS